MGRKTKTTTIQEELPDPVIPLAGDGLPDFGEVADADVPPDLYGVMEQLGETVSKVILHKMDRTGKSPYLTTLMADEFDNLQQVVADQFGGGRYIAKLYGTPMGGGKPGVLKTYTFWIDESVRAKPQAVQEPVGRGGGGDRDALIERLLDKLTDRSAQRDPMEIAAQLAAASAAQVKNSIDVIAPLLDKLLATKGGGTSTADILKAVELGVGLGGDGSDGGYLPVIREVGVPLVQALQEHLGKPGGAMAKPLKPPTADPTKPPWFAMLRPYILGIVPYIQTGTAPELVAATVELQAPALGEWLATAVSQLGFPDQLFTAFPELQVHREWVARFLAEFADEEPAPGNTVTAEPAEPDDGGLSVG